jgi:hypothetical protein
MQEYLESVLRRKKSIPYKPYVRAKHVESILGTFKSALYERQKKRAKISGTRIL